MKKLLTFIFMICGAFAEAEQYPEADPEKPIYQKQWGGAVIAWPVGDVDRVRLPDPKTAEQAKMQAEIERIKAETAQFKKKLEQELRDRKHGVRWMRIGVALFVIGGIAFVFLKHYQFELVGVSIAVSGVGAVCYGAIMIKVAENATAIAWAGVAVIVLGIAAYFCHGKGLSFRETLARFKNKT